MTNQFEKYQFPKEKFELIGSERTLKDVKLDTKPVGYFKDAFMRFSRNKASVVAAIIILVLVLFAIVGPFCGHQSYTEAYKTDNTIINYKYLLPKLSFMEGTGIWDGTKKEEVSLNKLNIYRAMEEEMNANDKEPERNDLSEDENE